MVLSQLVAHFAIRKVLKALRNNLLAVLAFGAVGGVGASYLAAFCRRRSGLSFHYGLQLPGCASRGAKRTKRLVRIEDVAKQDAGDEIRRPAVIWL